MHKIIFESNRLSIAELNQGDQDRFIELLSSIEIIKLIPQPAWPLKEILSKFQIALDYQENPLNSERVFWGVHEKGEFDLIGLCFIITNDENQREFGYRFRKKYWGQGYGSELALHTIDYCFNNLKMEVLTADAWIENKASLKILEKFMYPVKEFYNSDEHCTDRRYEIQRKDWIKG